LGGGVFLCGGERRLEQSCELTGSLRFSQVLLTKGLLRDTDTEKPKPRCGETAPIPEKHEALLSRRRLLESELPERRTIGRSRKKEKEGEDYRQ